MTLPSLAPCRAKEEGLIVLGFGALDEVDDAVRQIPPADGPLERRDSLSITPIGDEDDFGRPADEAVVGQDQRRRPPGILVELASVDVEDLFHALLVPAPIECGMQP